MANPVLRLQTGTLYASNDASTFTGTGGPWGFSVYTSQFGGVVSSAGLTQEPFNDTVYAVQAGDEVVFVVAVINTTPGQRAFDVRVKVTPPPGFAAPADGANLSVTDGAGTDLSISGDPFSSAGLLIGSPLAGYDADNGLNVALVTYTLQAQSSLPGPLATITSRADLLHASATSGGADVAALAPATASTSIVTAAPDPRVAAEADASAIAAGQTIAFDVTIPLPGGTLQDLRLDTILPAGTSDLSFVSASVTHIGAGLRVGTPIVGTDGSIAFGTVTATPGASDDTLGVRLELRAGGTSSGPATVRTVISALSAGASGGRWTADIASSVGVVVPPVAPNLSGIWTAQRATTTIAVHPFGGVGLDAGQTSRSGTLAVTLQDASLGRLSATGAGSVNTAGSTFVMTGTFAELQAAARQIVFTPSQVGTEYFTLTLAGADGSVAQDGSAALTIAASTDTAHAAQHFAPAPSMTFLTATGDGQQTLANGEEYHGPVDYLRGQYIYDGSQKVAIVAQAPNVFVKNFTGDAAVALLSGQNVVDAGQGSNFLIGGTGTDVFFLDGRSNAVTWNTIVGFHAGDIATLFGFKAGVSSYWWEDSAGAVGYEGADVAGGSDRAWADHCEPDLCRGQQGGDGRVCADHRVDLGHRLHDHLRVLSLHTILPTCSTRYSTRYSPRVPHDTPTCSTRYSHVFHTIPRRGCNPGPG